MKIVVLWASRVHKLLQIFTKPDLMSAQTEPGNHTQIDNSRPLCMVLDIFTDMLQKKW